MHPLKSFFFLSKVGKMLKQVKYLYIPSIYSEDRMYVKDNIENCIVPIFHLISLVRSLQE